MLENKLFQYLKKRLWSPVAPIHEPIDNQKHLGTKDDSRNEDKACRDAVLTEQETLAQCGFTASQILALFYLRQWYQSGGSDRSEVIKHLEFLKRLLLNGKIEL